MRCPKANPGGAWTQGRLARQPGGPGSTRGRSMRLAGGFHRQTQSETAPAAGAPREGRAAQGGLRRLPAARPAPPLALIAVGDRAAKSPPGSRNPRRHDVDRMAHLKIAASTARDCHGRSADRSGRSGRRRAGAAAPGDDSRVELIDPDEAGHRLHHARRTRRRNPRRSWTDPKGSQGEGAAAAGRTPAHRQGKMSQRSSSSALRIRGPGARARRALQRERWPSAPGDSNSSRSRCGCPTRAGENVRRLQHLEIGPDGHLYLLSDKSASIARIGRPAGAWWRGHALAKSWRLPDLNGKPEGFAFTPRAERSSHSTRARRVTIWSCSNRRSRERRQGNRSSPVGQACAAHRMTDDPTGRKVSRTYRDDFICGLSKEITMQRIIVAAACSPPLFSHHARRHRR